MTVGHPSIAIVVTFFGRAPFWLPAFLLSCRENRDVQWLIYTDLDVSADVPPNVALKRMGVSELNLRSSEIVGTKIEIQVQRRMLCDLKPAYGLIFADDLQPFDFWACSDLDIVWGSVRQFVTDALLRDHDIVSSRSNKLSGHFTLFRNTATINRLFEQIPNVKAAMASSHYAHLDEREFTRYLKERLDSAAPPASPRVYWREEWTTNAAYQKALGDAAADSLWWRDGRTFGHDGRELMYIHFHKLKQSMDTINFRMADSPRAFRINRHGFLA